MQCTSNAYFAIIFSAIKSIDIWKTFDLDYILEQGDNIFKQVGVYQLLAVDELPHDTSIEGTQVSAKILAHESNLFVEKENLLENYRRYDSTGKGNGAIFTCAGFSVAVLWLQHYVYVFDSHSRNSSGFHDSNGKAVLQKFCSINSLNNYLKSFYYMVSIDTQYDLKYVGIEIDLNRRIEINCKLQRKRKMLCNRNHSSKKEIKMRKNAKQKIYYEKNKDQILNSKKVYYQKNVNAIRTQQRAYYTENAASKKRHLPPITDNNFQYLSLTDKIDIVIEQNSEYFSDIDFVRDRNSKYYQSNCESKKDKQRKYYTENSDNICKMKKAYYKRNNDSISRKRSSYYNENIDLIRLKQSNYYLENKNRIREKQNRSYASHCHRILDSRERISLFSKICKEGPTSVCVICNRCLYKRSVNWFDPDKYLFEFGEISDIGNSDTFICLTCDRYLKKQKIPPQAVWNKVEVFMVPEVLSNLNRFERVLISRRILF